MSIVFFILEYMLVVYSIIMIAITLKELFKEISSIKIIGIAIGIAILLFYFHNISIFGYTYNFIFSRILILGIYALIIRIIVYFLDQDDRGFAFQIKKGLIVAIIIGMSIWIFTTGKVNNIVFEKMPYNVTQHFEKKNIKKEAKKLTPEKELNKILDELKKENYTDELSREKINFVINKLGYRDYNGIYCYAVEHKDGKYIVGMVYGDVEIKIKKPKHFTETNNFYVNEKLEIVGIYNGE